MDSCCESRLLLMISADDGNCGIDGDQQGGKGRRRKEDGKLRRNKRRIKDDIQMTFSENLMKKSLANLKS